MHGPDAVTLHLGPDVRLGPVNPGTAQFERTAQAFFQPGAAADTLAGFQHDDAEASLPKFTGCNESCEAGPDNDDVGLLG